MDNPGVKHLDKDMHTEVRCQANLKEEFKLLHKKWKQYRDFNSLVFLKVKQHKRISHVTKTKNMQLTFCLNQQLRTTISTQVQASLSQCSHQINSPLAAVMVVTSQAVVMEAINQKEVAMVAMDLHSTNEFESIICLI